MDTGYIFDGWGESFLHKHKRVNKLRQGLHHLPASSSAFFEIQRSYQFYVDDIQEGANNFAEEVLQKTNNDQETPQWRSSFDLSSVLKKIKQETPLDYGYPLAKAEKISLSTKEQISRSLHDLLKNVQEKDLVARAPVRGGNLPNRKAQFAKIPRETVLKDTIMGSSEAACQSKRPLPGDMSEGRYCSRPAKRIIKSSPERIDTEEGAPFVTARQQLITNSHTRQANQPDVVKKSLGGRGPRTAFVPPFARSDNDLTQASEPNSQNRTASHAATPESCSNVLDERLRQFDQRIVDLVMSEIMDSKTQTSWDDIAGLHSVKATLKEVVIFPMLRPDIFTGLRGPPKGLLLFGPPGTGKTLIGKCIASTSQSTFFSISASSLTSKWVGDGEKMVRALFTIARIHQPSVIFIDEIDSLLSQRSETEHESSRRIKTEFLVQLDGVNTGAEDRLLLIGATNRPQELDEAARRRFVKRLYVPLPCEEARREIVERLLHRQKHNISPEDLDVIAARSEGFSGADVANLCKEAAMGPIRGLTLETIQSISCNDVPPVRMVDFNAAFQHVKSSVSPADLKQYLSWNQQYGSFQV